jgi:predicted DNA-binding protein (MmcQ/YjbR family)
VDVVNLKVSPEMIPSLTQETGIFPAYHMNKSHWVTAALDGTASDEMVAFLAGVSFDLTVSKLKSKRQ